MCKNVRLGFYSFLSFLRSPNINQIEEDPHRNEKTFNFLAEMQKSWRFFCIYGEKLLNLRPKNKKQ